MILVTLFKNASIVLLFLLTKQLVRYQLRNTFSFLLSFVNGNLNFQLTIVVCTESGFCRVASMSQKHLSVFERLS